MNINTTTSLPLKPQLPVQGPVSRPTESQASKALTDQEKKEAFAKAFYTKEEEPWRGKFYRYSDDTVKNELREMTKKDYLAHIKTRSNIELSIQNCMYDKFKKNIADMRPDLAEKNFSFTLGDDAELKILDPEKKLNYDDLRWLTNAINAMTDFKDSVHKSAKFIMTIVDHDTKNFSEKSALSLLNFQDTIDLGKVLRKPKDDMNEEWIKQIKENSNQQERSLIDTYV